MFEVIMFIAAIAIIVILLVLLENVRGMKRQLLELWQWLGAAREQQYHQSGGTVPPPQVPQGSQAPQPWPQVPLQGQQVPPQVPQGSPPPQPWQVPPPHPQPQPLPIQQQQPQPQPQPLPVQQQQPQPLPTQPQRQPQPQQPQQPQPSPPYPAPAPHPAPYPARPQPVAATSGSAPQIRSVENLLGRNILGVIAAILVFLGLVSLGFLVVPFLTDGIKIVLMFLLSAALLGGGFLLNRRFSNNFTKALLGCGCGAFFISIMVTHLYFHALNEIVAFSLLLVWIALSLLLTRQSQSLLVGIITHAGMMFSVCAGYLHGLDDSRLVLLMVYQLLSTVLIVGGTILCYKRMYRFGLFASLALVVFTSCVMWLRFFAPYGGFASQLPSALIAAAFLLQFVGGSFLSYLLFVSCVRVRDAAIQMLLQGLNTLLWGMILFLDVTVLVVKLHTALGFGGVAGASDGARTFTGGLGGLSGFGVDSRFLATYDPLPWALVISLLVLAGVMFALVLLRRRMAFPEAMETTTVLLLTTAGTGLLLLHQFLHTLLRASGPSISYLVVLAVLLMVLWRLSGGNISGGRFSRGRLGSGNLDGGSLSGGRLSGGRLGSGNLDDGSLGEGSPSGESPGRNRVLAIAARVALGLDGLLMLCGGFWELVDFGTTWLALAYLAVMLALAYLSYRGIEATRRGRYTVAVRIVLVLALQVSLVSVLTAPLPNSVLSPSFVDWRPALFFLICAAVLLIVMTSKQDKPVLFFRINEFVIMILAAGEIAFDPALVSVTVLHILTAILCFLILLERVRRLARRMAEVTRDPGLGRPRTGIEILGALAMTVLFLALINGLTDWFERAYSLSLAAMFIALVIVALGFWSRCNTLRLYGLVLVLATVLKLVTYDIRDLDSLMRVISFIGGGLICFGISALYNFTVRRLGSRYGAAPPPPPPPTGPSFAPLPTGVFSAPPAGPPVSATPAPPAGPPSAPPLLSGASYMPPAPPPSTGVPGSPPPSALPTGAPDKPFGPPDQGNEAEYNGNPANRS